MGGNMIAKKFALLVHGGSFRLCFMAAGCEELVSYQASEFLCSIRVPKNGDILCREFPKRHGNFASKWSYVNH